MKSRAAVAFAPGKPLEIVEVDVAPPKAGEVLIKLPIQGYVIPMLSHYLVMTQKVFSQRF